jgi:hypothetical protein
MRLLGNDYQSRNKKANDSKNSFHATKIIIKIQAANVFFLSLTIYLFVIHLIAKELFSFGTANYYSFFLYLSAICIIFACEKTNHSPIRVRGTMTDEQNQKNQLQRNEKIPGLCFTVPASIWRTG